MNAAARVIMNLSLSDHVKPALKQLHWLPVEQRITYKLCLFMHHIHTGQAPQYLRVARLNGLRSAKNKNYTVSQKNKTFGHNFTNYYPIFKIFSPVNSVVNLQQIQFQIFYHVLNMPLDYLVKYECQKNGIILKYILQLMMNHKVV